MTLLRLLLVTFFLASPALAHAARLVYVNGIQNSFEDALDTSKRLLALMQQSPSKFNLDKPDKLTFVWNKIGFSGVSKGEPDLNEDLQELFASKTNEEFYALDFQKIKLPHQSAFTGDLDAEAAVRITQRIANELESIRAPISVLSEEIDKHIAANEAVIVIAHSQGNLIANLGWAKAVATHGEKVRRQLRIVNVANTTRRSPNDLNFTHAGDAALFYRADVAACPENSLETLPSRKNWKRLSPVCSANNDGVTPAICDFNLSPPTFKASNSGSGSIDSGSVIGGGIDACLDHSIVLTYMSEAVVEQEIDQGIDFSNSRAFKQRLVDFIYQGIKSTILTPNLALSDDFLGSTIDSTKWTLVGLSDGSSPQSPTVANSWITFPQSSRISTEGKLTFTGRKIVIESRMVGLSGSRDTGIYLVDTMETGASLGNSIWFGDTTYYNAMYAGAYGIYSNPAPYILVTSGTSTNQWMEYRLTIDGDRVTVERGMTLNQIDSSQTRTFTLARSIVGRSFFLNIGTGGPAYSPGTFDWVRVTTTQ